MDLGQRRLRQARDGPAQRDLVRGGDRDHRAVSFSGVDGFAHSRWFDQVQVTLDDGSTIKPQVLWVSPPIRAGFFFYRAPAGHTITAVRALRRGTVVAADDGGSGAAAPGAHPFADLARKTKIAAIQTDAGAATLWTAPTLTDGRCTWLQYRQQELSVMPCLPQGYEHQAALAFGVHALGGHTILAGECGYSAVEFIHNDGTTRTVACTDGLILADLQPPDASGELRAIDAQGRPLPGSTTQVPPAAPQP